MKGYEKVKELVEGELSNYSYFNIGEIKVDNCYDQTEEDEYYTVDIGSLNLDSETKSLCFHYNRKEDKIEIELGEDNFEEVDDYSYKVKYFWMALLKW
jgi:hypothetical protein